MLIVAFGAVCAILSLASWMGWWSGWMSLPTGRLALTVLPGGIGVALIGVSLLLPEDGALGFLAGVLAVAGFLLMLLFAVAVLTMPRWSHSAWFISWMSSRYPGYEG